MRQLFYNASSFNQPLDTWNVTNVSSMSYMFYGASNFDFDQPLGSWNVSNVNNMNRMFKYATTFDQPLNTWNIASTTNMEQMFLDAGLSQQNLDNTLTSWAVQSVQPNVPFHLGAKTYSTTGATALDTLRTTHNWTITE